MNRLFWALIAGLATASGMALTDAIYEHFTGVLSGPDWVTVGLAAAVGYWVGSGEGE